MTTFQHDAAGFLTGERITDRKNKDDGVLAALEDIDGSLGEISGGIDDVEAALQQIADMIRRDTPTAGTGRRGGTAAGGRAIGAGEAVSASGRAASTAGTAARQSSSSPEVPAGQGVSQSGTSSAADRPRNAAGQFVSITNNSATSGADPALSKEVRALAGRISELAGRIGQSAP
ncbi:MAG: hypothetical protein RL260_3827, partial [Pseudomonadota bacterium]